MSGEPFAQARALVGAIIDSLTDQDQLEMLAFSNQPHRWRPQPVRATADARAAAGVWLAGLEPGGGTEMTEAIKAALAPLRADGQRQVLLVTDGLVGFEDEIVWHVLSCLPRTSRLHAVGVGHAVNRSLTGAVARAGGGAEVVVASNEPVESAAARLVARTSAPMAANVEVSGSALRAVAPVRLPDIMAGAPCTVALLLHPAGGELVVRADFAGAAWEQRTTLPAMESEVGRAAVMAHYGREAVADVEMRIASGDATAADAEIERLGLAFAISTRLTSWIAVTMDPTVDPTRATRRVEVAQAVPAGLSVLGLGLRPARGFGADFEATILGTYFGELGAVRRAGGDVRTKQPMQKRITPLRQRFLGRLSASARRPLSGRIITLAPDRIVVEFEVGGSTLVWDPDASVILVLKGRRRVQGSIELRDTTAPGRIGSGLTVRLVVRLDHPLPDAPRRVRLDTGGTTLTIEIADP